MYIYMYIYIYNHYYFESSKVPVNQSEHYPLTLCVQEAFCPL